jgi:hypothetical protein
MLWASATHQEYAGLDGELNGGRHRRISQVPVSEKKAKFSIPSPSLQARDDEKNEENAVVMGVSTARHGAASIAGDERGRRVRVSSLGRNRAERGKIGGFRAIYTFTGVCWRSRIPAATADVALGVAVASTWASREEDEDEDVFLVFILAKRYEGW